ncbi:MAG: hypothetical protein PHW60_01650 [Kiritimatiellae bacterium]|nr:hypothetical protein [Kiritimatiellia bacterium]
MKLIYKPIPDHFLKALPEGVKFVRRHQSDFLVAEQINCPRGHSLMAEVVRIHGEPSIRIRVQVGKSEGLVFIDAFWGGHAKLYNFIPDIISAGSVIKALCPVCGVSLIVADHCAQMGCKCDQAIVFALPGKTNKIYVCARLGCPGHRMEISALSHKVLAQVSKINYFGAQDNDIFMEI